MPTEFGLPRVGFIGLGQMGRTMALNLLKAGYPLTVFTRGSEKTSDLVARGAIRADLPAGVARASTFVFISLSTETEFEQILFGAGGLAESAKPGLCVIDCSTNAAANACKFAQRLKASGIEMVDCQNRELLQA